MSSMRVHVSIPQYSITSTNIFVCLNVSLRLFQFCKATKINSRFFLKTSVALKSIAQDRSVSMSKHGKEDILNQSLHSRLRCYVLNFPFHDRKPTIGLFGDDSTQCFVKTTTCFYKSGRPCPVLKNFLRQSETATSGPNLCRKSKTKTFTPWQNRADYALVDTVNENVTSILSLSFFSLQ